MSSNNVSVVHSGNCDGRGKAGGKGEDRKGCVWRGEDMEIIEGGGGSKSEEDVPADNSTSTPPFMRQTSSYPPTRAFYLTPPNTRLKSRLSKNAEGVSQAEKGCGGSGAWDAKTSDALDEEEAVMTATDTALLNGQSGIAKKVDNSVFCCKCSLKCTPWGVCATVVIVALILVVLTGVFLMLPIPAPPTPPESVPPIPPEHKLSGDFEILPFPTWELVEPWKSGWCTEETWKTRCVYYGNWSDIDPSILIFSQSVNHTSTTHLMDFD